MAKAPSKPTSKTTPKTKATSKRSKVVSKASSATAKTSDTTAKKATLKTALKTPVKAKPTTTKSAKLKTTPKKAKKSAVKKASKSVTTTAVTPPSPKTTASSTARAKSTSTTTLQAKLDDVTKRLSAADSHTKKNIAALETDFTALAKQMGRTKAGHTRLTRRVTELSKTLSQDLEAVQNDIRRELASVLQNPTLEKLHHALSRADARLHESETAQDAAIARINRHIADIATIVEERLSDEANARIAAMAEMKREMSRGQDKILTAQAALENTQKSNAQANQLRFSNMQSESADAIRSLGDKLVDVAEEMGRRRETLASRLRQELSESTLAANAEFEQFRRVVERRLEALETDVASLDGQIERAVAPLASRIEGLEYGLTQSPEPQYQDYAPALQAAPPMNAQNLSPQNMTSPLAAPVNQTNSEDAYSAPAASYASAAMEDAFSPAPEAAHAVAPPMQASPQDAPLELNEPAPAQAVPFDPQAYPATAYAAPQTQYAAASQPPHAESYVAQSQHGQSQNYDHAYTQNPYGQAAPAYDTPYPAEQSYDAKPLNAPQEYAQTQPPFPNVDDLPLSDADLPYADPAYAEGQFNNPNMPDDSMGAARPGAFDNLKNMGRKARQSKSVHGEPSAMSALLTPRNLKLGGLVAALGVASFIGVQTLKGNSAPSNGPEFSVASNAALDESRPSLGEILPASEARPPAGMMSADGTPIGPKVDQEAIGNYADNRKMALVAGGETALSAAAQAGNPIAQLQLGLSKIETGELEAGVELIRASANQEQPAALYRLAKLYETGQGVGQDAKTARQLTERAARGGNRIAMHDLALYFAEGRGGVEIDMPTAAKWFEKAAQRGVVDSQFNLGVLFESGQGLPQDMESALMWYSIAGTQGDQMAAGRVGVLRQTLSEEQIERADKRIAAFTPSRIDEHANGIFNDVPWAKPAQVAQVNADKQSVIQTQTLLNELGYAVGTADGAIGPKTKNAILNFQRNNSMSETGTVNAELIERLEMAAGA